MKKVVNKELEEFIVITINHINSHYDVNSDVLFKMIRLCVDYNDNLGIISDSEIKSLLDLNTNKYINDCNVHVDSIYDKYRFNFLALDNAFIEGKKFENKHYYEKFVSEKEKGKNFNISDLTKDILYELLVVEKCVKSMIAILFNITVEQVIYLQKKYNLENVFQKFYVDYPQELIKKIDDINYYSSYENLPDVAFRYVYYVTLRNDHGPNGKWRTETYIDYMEERVRENYGHYKIIYDNDISGNKKLITIKKRKNNGRYINQDKVYFSKKISGKIGEDIVYNEEVKKLKKLKFYDLIPKVKLVPKTNDENVTFDGVGYDVISFNEKREKIRIEVKTSLTDKNGKIKFFLSNKELNFINGKLDDIPKEQAFIYYVYNVDTLKHSANIKVINYKEFESYNIYPILYCVEDL